MNGVESPRSFTYEELKGLLSSSSIQVREENEQTYIDIRRYPFKNQSSTNNSFYIDEYGQAHVLSRHGHSTSTVTATSTTTSYSNSNDDDLFTLPIVLFGILFIMLIIIFFTRTEKDEVKHIPVGIITSPYTHKCKINALTADSLSLSYYASITTQPIHDKEEELIINYGTEWFKGSIHSDFHSIVRKRIQLYTKTDICDGVMLKGLAQVIKDDLIRHIDSISQQLPLPVTVLDVKLDSVENKIIPQKAEEKGFVCHLIIAPYTHTINLNNIKINDSVANSYTISVTTQPVPDRESELVINYGTRWFEHTLQNYICTKTHEIILLQQNNNLNDLEVEKQLFNISKHYIDSVSKLHPLPVSIKEVKFKKI